MKASVILFILTLLFSMPLAAKESNCEDESRYPLITKNELQEVVKDKSSFIVDVNSKDSYEKSHVPGAIHFGSHQKDFTKLLPENKSKMIVAYCGGPQCTAWRKAAIEACKLGYTNIRHFKDGISGWGKSS
jgi:rhodanese-related sulfurtransferase